MEINPEERRESLSPNDGFEEGQMYSSTELLSQHTDSPISDTIGRPQSSSSVTSSNIPTEIKTSLPSYFGNSAQTPADPTDNAHSTADDGIPAIQISPDDATDAGSSSASIISKSYMKMHMRQSSVLSANSMAISTPDSSSIGRQHFSIDHRLKSRLGSLASANSGSRRQHKSSQKSQDLDFFMDPSNLSSPWEAMRWSKLRRLSTQLYSDTALAAYGRPTVTITSSVILIGTSKGLVLVFDYHQTLLHVLGEHKNVAEYGQVSSLAISTDDSSVAIGYESGFLLLWDLNRQASFSLKISPIAHVSNDKEGHLQGASILHLTFINGHNSLVSADSKGMVFLHDTYRTMLGRTARSRLILGKYSTGFTESRPTTIFACSTQSIAMGSGSEYALAAVMTPYHLVVISPLPAPQSQFKESRSTEANFSMGFSACLAWYSGFKTSHNGSSHSRLAYCWSNVLKILELVYKQNARSDSVQLSFRSKKKYISDEPIVDVEWITSSLIAIVTVTQRLIIINEKTMNACATADLIDKHVMHYDNYSSSTRNLQLPLSHNGPKEPVVTTDDFTHCIKAYRSKLFILGKYEFVVGTLSTWADRLMNIIEAGDHVRAIELATSFYVGDEDSVLLGLPQDDTKRHEIVGNTMPDLIISCVRSGLHALAGKPDEAAVREMADACLVAACSIDDDDILDVLYDSFENAHLTLMFVERLMKSIYDGEITTLPPGVFKKLVLFVAESSENAILLEDVICRLDTSTMDLDLTLQLCRKYNLRDTEIYVWTTAFHDYISPLTDLLNSVNMDLKEGHKSPISDKIYPFISYVLTGRVYPAGSLMQDEELMITAKSSVYEFLFFGNIDDHLKQNGFLRSGTKFPFISLLVAYDSAAFFTALNEIFEDSYLNNNDESAQASFFTGKQNGGISISRQLIIDILLELFFSDAFGPEKVIYFDIFVARNYSKFSQFLILPGKQLEKILDDLCLLATPEMKEECEIAVQSLLSKYRPEDIDRFITIFFEQKYYLVLQYLYKARQKYSDYLKVSFQLFSSMKSSTEVSNLFSIMSECLSNTMDYLHRKERTTIEGSIVERFEDLAKLDCSRLVDLLNKFAPKLHDTVFSLSSKDLQERYLKEQFRTCVQSDNSKLPSMKARNLYVSLLARNGQHNELRGLLKSALTGPDDIQLPAVVDDLIEYRSIDILVELLCRQQRHSEAMIYLVNHFFYLHDEYKLTSAHADQLEKSFLYYVKIGVELCQRIKNDRETMEKLWVSLLDTLIQLSCDPVFSDTASSDTLMEIDDGKVAFERGLLENALSCLLGSSGATAFQHDRSVISIFRSLLSNDAQNIHTVGVMRSILGDIFSSYRHQSVMLEVARNLLDNDNYDSLMDLVDERLRGWRVAKSGECEGCGQKIVGVGIDASWLYKEWTDKEREQLMDRAYGNKTAQIGNEPGSKSTDTSHDILVVFKCGHSYHLSCLGRLGVNVRDRLQCLICENEESKGSKS